jgi:protease-4
MTRHLAPPLVLLLLVAILAPACAPLSVTFTLGAQEQPLRETAVLEDAHGPADAKVALIDVRGTIIDAARPGLFGSGANPVDELVARLKMAEDDPEVRAVVIRINSPGGSVTASDIVYTEVRRFADTTKKPVVASLGEVAASGGYYLALAADEIVAQPTSITASIGVIIPTVNVSDGLRRIGIVARSIKSGENKDLANPLEPIRESQYAVLQGMVDDFYARFRGLVVERRPTLDTSRLDELTDGRVVTGAEAVKAGLADHEGSVRDAFDRAKHLAGITSARLVRYHTDTARPRSPYSPTATAEAPAANTEVNLIQLDLGEAGLGSATNAYYLWAPLH